MGSRDDARRSFRALARDRGELIVVFRVLRVHPPGSFIQLPDGQRAVLAEPYCEEWEGELPESLWRTLRPASGFTYQKLREEEP